MRLRQTCRFLILISLVVLAGSSVYAQAPVTEADDAYHLKSWEGSPYTAAYTEWWYFNLYDVKDDIQAIMTYQVADPLNLTGQGVSDMTVVVYDGQTIIPESDLYPLSAFSASYSATDVTLGSNTILVTGPNRYLVQGSSLDGRLSWKLAYDRDTSSWFAGDHIDVGPPSWEQMSWLLYMPRAKVSGILVIDGRTYNIECSGYHDHNWGEWNFSSVIWNWAQYSQPGLSFDLGDFVGNPNGRASIDICGKRTVFSASEYTLVHTKWAFDPVYNLPYPTQSVFTAEHGDVRVRMTMDIQKTEPLGTGPPPSLVIYEQPSHFAGTVNVRDRLLPREISFEGNGFKEYTAVTSANP